jgi:hypothetical protein
MVLGAAVAASAVVLAAAPASACGGLVGENGTIQLTKTTTLAAYHAGVEHYVTSFEFSGSGEAVGSIVPLPGVPTAVERGGDWTLQRLGLEVAPPALDEDRLAFAASTAGAEVLLQTRIDALDLTVLKGGGDDVGKWALDNGFLLSPDAPEVLDFYARRSPIFLAAKFDASAAAALGQRAGDGTPIQLTIPTSRPWVPLRILSLGLGESAAVDADVFLLTDDRPQLLAGGAGLDLAVSEQASSSLLSDLRSDEGTDWVPDDAWLSYLQLHSPAGKLTYDLAVSTTPTQAASLVDAGIALTGDHPVAVVPAAPASVGSSRSWAWTVLAVCAGLGCLLVIAVGTGLAARRR